MKEKILYLVLGILIGAVITAGIFVVFSKNRGPEMRGGERPDFTNMSEEERENFRKQRPEDGNFERPEKMNENTTSTDEAINN